jgi:hypothetical protein
MKHIVTVTTSNPAHEHVSLRRRQSTTNYMVEARNEDEALLRATAHFRGLGHYIHEAKIFKKKDEQLIEGAAALKQPFNKETNIGSVVPGSSKNVGTANQYFDVTTGKTVTRTTQNDIEWEKEKRDAHTRNLMATDKPIEPLFPELDILGGVTRAGASILSMIRGAAVPRPSRTPRRVPPRRTPARPPSRPPRRRPSVPTPSPQEKPVETPKKPGEVVPFPTKPAPAPAPVTLPPAKPSTPAPAPLPPAKPAPAPAPQPKPAPAPAPQPGKSPSPQPVPVPKESPAGKTPSSPPVTRPSPIAGPKSDPRQLPATSGKGGGKSPRRPFVLPRLRLGDRPDQDIGTLGQYRGMFPLYQFADFNSLQESQVKPMNAIGRVMTKRKEKSKENAESEKNKINMEPTLKSGKN